MAGPSRSQDLHCSEFWPFNIDIEKKEDRRSFILRTYIQLGAYLLLALLQWGILVLLPRPTVPLVVETHESALLVMFFMSLLFFLLFAISNQLRALPCINLLVTLIIVECQVLAIGLLAVRTNILRLVLGFLVVSIIEAVVPIIIILWQPDITTYATSLFLIAFCLFMFNVYLVVLHIILKLVWIFCVYCVSCMLLIFPILAYHVQTVLGNGLIRTSLTDDKFAALLLFHDFLALFMLTFYWAPTRGKQQ